MAESAAVERFCSGLECSNPASYRCGRCQKIWYCSSECQRFHWRAHKHNCASSLAPESSSPPLAAPASAGAAISAPPPPTTGIFRRLQTDSWLNISLFLPLASYASLMRTCRYAAGLLQGDALSRLYYSSVFQLRFRLPIPLDIRACDARAFIRSVLESSRGSFVYSLVQDCVAVSSRDRAEERARNVVTESACCKFVSRHVGLPQLSGYTREEIGQHAQQAQCGCAGNQPCYWSASPSETQSTLEYLTFNLHASVSLVCGFAVTPYQAFFQPSAPVYPPDEVVLQFLLPRPAAGAGAGAAQRNVVQRLTESQLFDSGEVYWQSPSFHMSKTFAPQCFMLHNPVLIAKGVARLVMRGCLQRQTLGGALLVDGEDLPHAEDWYICISHVQLFGFHLDNGFEAAVQPAPAGVSVGNGGAADSPRFTLPSRQRLVVSARETPGTVIPKATRLPPHTDGAAEARQAVDSFLRKF